MTIRTDNGTTKQAEGADAAKDKSLEERIAQLEAENKQLKKENAAKQKKLDALQKRYDLLEKLDAEKGAIIAKIGKAKSGENDHFVGDDVVEDDVFPEGESE